MHGFIIEAIARGGYWGIALLMALENIVPPIPSEVIMGLGGVLVARGDMAFWPLLIAGTVGSTLGNYAWFWLGQRWGYERTRPFVERWGRWLTIDWPHVEAASRFFRSHGQWVVLVLRFSPFLRTLISLPAGLARMSVWKFLAFTFIGAGIWNTLLIFAATVLSRYFAGYEAAMGWAVLGLVGLAVVAYVWRVLTWKPRRVE
jgi:membrane protein DedA with SNARE-associated domain